MNMKGHHRAPNGNSFSTTASSTTPQVYITNSDNVAQSPEQLPAVPDPTEPKHWNRWLVILQIFTAPLFVVFIYTANFPPSSSRTILTHILCSLLLSLTLLIPILLTTTPDHPPAWRSGLCFLGFAVAIAWISTIANEVVGVLRTLGVILNMSDAILGLTIFAVGNSLGDLVADITVAKLGYPVMALSACFGGPMLNILLGIGLSGSYILVTGAHHHQHKHPGSELRYKSYQIEVGRTLIVTGFTLLLTLVGLLIAVPLNKWVLSKRIGVALIALWVTTTIINVALELTGWGTEGSDN